MPIYREQGDLVTVVRPYVQKRAAIGNKRGKVGKQSRASRNRLLRVFARLQDAPAYLTTLTYPDGYSHNPTRWKRDLKVYMARAERMFLNVACIWKLGVRRRKSGEHEGQPAPHFQVVAFTTDERFPDWSEQAWGEISGATHFYCESIDSRRTVAGLFGKWSSLHGMEGVGRWWGIYHREHLPFAEVTESEIDDDTAVATIKQMIKQANIRKRNYVSLSVFKNPA